MSKKRALIFPLALFCAFVAGLLLTLEVLDFLALL